MKTITIKKVKYSCPESWHEVTLKQAIEVNKITDTMESPIDKKLAILSTYAGIPMQVLKSEKIDRMVELFQAISFISEDIPSKQLIEFDFKENHYHTGQNIVDMEFQDFVSIQNALEMYSGSTYEALPVMVAIMAKRKKADGTLESIDDYDVMQRAEEFMDLPIPIANGIAFFFASSIRMQENLTTTFQNPKELVMNHIDEVLNTLNKQDGVVWHTRLLNGILRKYIKSIKKDVDKSFTS